MMRGELVVRLSLGASHLGKEQCWLASVFWGMACRQRCGIVGVLWPGVLFSGCLFMEARNMKATDIHGWRLDHDLKSERRWYFIPVIGVAVVMAILEIIEAFCDM